MAVASIQTSFASGEWAPKLRSRVDVQKYRAGAALLRNFFVDYSGGGASTRQGTRFIAQVGANGARLIQFQASTTVSYILEFGQNYIRFFTNGGQVMSGGVPYQISSPYLASDLFPNQSTGNPGLKFVQDANSLIICHPSYQPAILTINAPTNWTLTTINFGPTIATPTGLAGGAGSNLGAGTWFYGYTVTALDQNNQESDVATPVIFSSLADLRVTVGQIQIVWTAVPGAVSYNVYKTAQTNGSAPSAGAQYGFIGNVSSNVFTDAEPGVDPDFSQTPPILQNPFAGASVTQLNLTANANYTTVPGVTIAAPSSGIQATGYVSLGVASETIAHGASYDIAMANAVSPVGFSFTLPGGVVLSVLTAHVFSGFQWVIDTVSIAAAGSLTGVGSTTPSNPVVPTGNNMGANFLAYNSGFGFNLTWHVGALVLVSGGEGYTSAPAVTFSAGGATATASLGTASAGNPGVPGFFQERLVLAAQPQAVQGYNMSQPASFFNFNVSNPSQADDAISGTIISEELNDIRWLIPVPTGIIAGTGKGAWTINGGGGISTLNPITPSNQTASPQAFNGANDLKPQKVNFDVIYGTNKGSYFRDLTYNIYANIFTGADITTLSNHLFFNHFFLDIAWSEEPFKTMWVVREDGQMLSLAFVKEQELIGWAHHDTNGRFKSVCSVIETVGNGQVVDAVYVIVERIVNNTVVQYVERMADRFFTYGYEDSWSVDCALQTTPQVSPPIALEVSGDASAVGNSVTLFDGSSSPFTSGMVGWTVRCAGGIYLITAFTDTSHVTATVVRVSPAINPYNPTLNIYNGTYTIWQPVTSVSGLTQLENMSVVGVADGVAIGPLTVSNTGTVTLPQAASKVTLGLAFLPQLQTLPLDLGDQMVQGKRKKIAAITARVADTLGLQIGTTSSTLTVMKDFQLGAIPSTSTGPGQKVSDLYNGDGRTVLDQAWQEAGNYFIQQNLPYPATVLGVMPEVVVGDTPSR